MNRTSMSLLLGLLALVLGLVAAVVAFVAAALVEIPGQNPPREVVAACIGAALFLGVCQYLVARRDRAVSARWLAALVMVTPLLLFVAIAEDSKRWIPVLIAGCIASFVAVVLALRTAPTSRPGLKD